MANPTGARGGNGRYTRALSTAKKDAEAAELRTRGCTYDQIAQQLGYSNRGDAYKAVQRCLDATLTEPGEAVRKVELDRLDAMQRAVLEVLERQHVVVQQGRVVRRRTDRLAKDPLGEPVFDDQGNPQYEWEEVLDDKPVLDAVAHLLKIQERRARLLGLDMPAKSHVTVEKVDPRDLELTELLNEAKAQRAAEEAQLKGGA